MKHMVRMEANVTEWDEPLYREMLGRLPAAVYICDEEGYITFYNRAAALLWGREPEIGKDRWNGFLKMYRPDGTIIPPDQSPTALALKNARAAQSEVTQQGYKLARAALLLASGRPLPELSKILASHSIIHAADGEFFREALLHACARNNLAVTKIKDRELQAIACTTLGRKPSDLTRFVNDLGKPLGSPWTQDEKFATLAAWLALAAHL